MHCGQLTAEQSAFLGITEMGNWGAGLFSDDTACDVRDGYRDLLETGLTGRQATDRLIKEYDAEAEETAFWLALAATQHRLGRLENRVKRKAIQIIDSGTDLEAWSENPDLVKKRRATLAKLRAQLLTEQPPEKRISKRFRDSTDWLVGDLIAYERHDQRYLVFRVVGHHADRGGKFPVCELLNWTGVNLPTEAALRRCTIVKGVPPHQHLTQFCIARTSARDLPTDRLHRLPFRLAPSKPCGGYYAVFWRSLEKNLKSLFGAR